MLSRKLDAHFVIETEKQSGRGFVIAPVGGILILISLSNLGHSAVAPQIVLLNSRHLASGS